MTVKLPTERLLESLLHRLVCFCACQNATLLEITCRGSNDCKQTVEVLKNAVSNLFMYYLHMSHEEDAMLIWVKVLLSIRVRLIKFLLYNLARYFYSYLLEVLSWSPAFVGDLSFECFLF